MTYNLDLCMALDELRHKDELIFLSAVSSLFHNGYENYTEENVKLNISKIIKEAKENQEDGIIPLITPEYLISITETAYELRNYKLWDLLAYLSQSVDLKTISELTDGSRLI